MEGLLFAAALAGPASAAELRRLVGVVRADFGGDEASVHKLVEDSYEEYTGKKHSELNSGTSIQVVKEQAPQMSKTILHTKARLQILWSSHKQAIQRRWLKKNAEKRKKIILNAWPEMPAAHRPDIKAFRRGLKDSSSKYCYLTPYINLEDLSGPAKFLSLLEVRSQYHPSLFAYSDSSPIDIAATAKAINADPAFGYTMILEDTLAENTESWCPGTKVQR